MVVRRDRLRADLATRRSRLGWVGIWTVATALGWSVIGTLAALLFPLSRPGSDENSAYAAFVVAGILAGVPVGVGQWLVLRRWVPAASRWILATVLGWALAFPIGLVVGFFTGLFIFAFGGVILQSTLPVESVATIVGYLIYLGPAAGLAVAGAVVGLSQSLVLQGWVVGARQWIRITAIGGIFVSLGVDFGSISGVPFLGILGACLFGAFTGWQLLRLLRQSPAVEQVTGVTTIRPILWPPQSGLIVLAALGMLVCGSIAVLLWNGFQEQRLARVVDIYDAESDSWRTVAPTGRPLGTRGIAVDGKAIFPRNCHDCDETLLDVYDASTDTWRTIRYQGSLQEPWWLIPVESKVLFFPVYDLTQHVDIYSVNSDTWSSGALSVGRERFGVAVVGSKAIIAGGCTDDQCDQRTDAVDIYDSGTGAWTTATLSQARNGLGAAVVGNRVLFFGGCSEGESNCDRRTRTLDIYDATTDSWSTARLPRTGGLRATTVGTKVLFSSGERHLCERSALVDIYDSNTQKWSTATLSQRRCDLAIATVADKVLFAGGCASPYSCEDYSNVVDIYDASTDSWSTAKLAVGRTDIKAVTAGNKALFVGGWGSTPSGESNSLVVDIYDATTNVWTSAKVSRPRGFPTTPVAIGSTVIVPGDWDD